MDPFASLRVGDPPSIQHSFSALFDHLFTQNNDQMRIRDDSIVCPATVFRNIGTHWGALKMELTSVILWSITLLYTTGMIPQVVLNYRLKSVSGLSDFLLWCYVNGYVAFLFYAFCLQLPLAYRVIVPCGFCVAMTLLFQRFYYANPFPAKLLALFSVNTLAVLWVCIYARQQPQLVGEVAGWVNVVAWSIYQLPQAVKVWSRRSVRGFSFLYLSMVALGNVLELSIAVMLGLPRQTVLTDLRSIFFYAVFCCQFWVYRR